MESFPDPSMNAAPQLFTDPDALAATVIRETGNNIIVGLPLGLGKANHIINSIYACAEASRSIHLEIFSALTLERPKAATELERRFIDPVFDRLFGAYPVLNYAKAMRAGTVPPNIHISEFFLFAGRWLHVPMMQQNYISANYTHAGHYLLARGVNVITQLVAKRTINGETRYSLSCNTDITLDLLKARSEGKANFVLIGQVNSELPFMLGEGDLPANTFSHILDSPDTDFTLFAPPKQPIPLPAYAMGIHIATLVPDGGTLQIGIGSEGDAAAASLIVRQRQNTAFREMAAGLNVTSTPSGPECGIFEQGLYGASEMFVDSFLELIKAGILKREVDGALLHAAFFVGPKSFYRALREMPDVQLAKIQMKAVSFVNELYDGEDEKRRARTNARFINSAMMATMLGAVISDGLENGQIVSGVGGQYNFVAQAFALEGARSILTVHATRNSGGKITSNIRWSYGHETIPRHLRDIIVTEYGVADLRGKSDQDVIAAMLSVTDSRFQADLLRQARDANKVPTSYEIPAQYCENTPERIERALKPFVERGLLSPFPLGCDFTEIEQTLIPALQLLREASSSPAKLLTLAFQGLFRDGGSKDESAALNRMGYDRPKTLAERFYRALLRAALTETSS